MVIVLIDPAADRLLCFLQTAVLIEPDLFLVQSAMKAFDNAIAFRVIERDAAVPIQVATEFPEN